jgi:hypothetical protein
MTASSSCRPSGNDLEVAAITRGWFYGILLGLWIVSDLARLSPQRRRATTSDNGVVPSTGA